MRDSYEEFQAVYQFCDPLKQSIEEIIELASAELIKEFGGQYEGTITHHFWEGEEDTERKPTPVSDANAIAIINLTDTADYQGGNFIIDAWPEPARLGNFGDWIGDPNATSQPLWLNEEGSLLMCRGDRAIGFRTLVSQSCRRLILELR